MIFIPWRALLWVLPLAVGIALLAFPRLGLGLTYLVFITVLGLCYEWCHYLIHSDYKPKTAVYRAIWRNHRQHHYKNEHYWFTVTSSGTADRVLRTYPDPATVRTSPTAKNLHAGLAAPGGELAGSPGDACAQALPIIPAEEHAGRMRLGLVSRLTTPGMSSVLAQPSRRTASCPSDRRSVVRHGRRPRCGRRV